MVHQCFAVSCRTLAFKAPLHPLILIPYKNNEQKILNIITYGIDNLRLHLLMLNPLSAHPTKWPNTLKQFVSKLPTNCGCVCDHFVKLVLKGLKFQDYGVFAWTKFTYETLHCVMEFFEASAPCFNAALTMKC